MDTLHELLDANLRLPPEFGAGLSSHLPMALHALRQLGASDDRLRGFFDRYAERFEGEAAPGPAEALADWREARGRIEAFAALRASFALLLAQHGVDATLRAALPDLWPGAAGAAFHGLIRSAHAVQGGHAGEIAAALAYWAARWQAAPEVGPRAALAVGDWAAQLEADALRLRFPGSLITPRIEAALHSPEYAVLADRVAIDGLRPLADWAADCYARSGNFTVLHLVTATRAARVLWPWTENRAAVLRGFVRAFTAGALASNLKVSPRSVPPRSWKELRAAAIGSDDDHVVKLVHALFEEAEAYGPARRLEAAARAAA